ncbi:hypothetical protein ACPPVQ_04505 [Diaminobutyricibacter sp. McL0618]|uniref:hypothetical protein n=1 Tax=Leifsonia sp. McL0618 TaxID=3415677 RepID=UPI003CEB8864
MYAKTTKRLSAIAAVPLMIALFTACSSGSPSAESTESEIPVAKTYTDMGEWQLAYAQCMRSEGVDMPDPSPDGEMTSTMTADQDAYAAASKKCVGKLGEAPAGAGGTQSKQEVLDQQLKIARCFRDNGVDMADPVDGHISGIPADAPKEVIKKCLGVDVPAGSEMAERK